MPIIKTKAIAEPRTKPKTEPSTTPRVHTNASTPTPAQHANRVDTPFVKHSRLSISRRVLCAVHRGKQVPNADDMPKREWSVLSALHSHIISDLHYE